jgi:hypothetical protein
MFIEQGIERTPAVIFEHAANGTAGLLAGLNETEVPDEFPVHAAPLWTLWRSCPDRLAISAADCVLLRGYCATMITRC